LLVAVAVLAVPAVVLALALDAVLSIVGLQPTTALLLVSTYIVGVVGVWVSRRLSDRT